MTSFLEENRKELIELEKLHPNNMEFGNNLRRLYRDDKFIMSIFNDQDLGKEIRKNLKNK
jgi:hypothetical protein